MEGSQQVGIFLHAEVGPPLAVALPWVTDSLNLRQSRHHGVGANACRRQGGRLQTVNHVPMEPARRPLSVHTDDCTEVSRDPLFFSRSGRTLCRSLSSRLLSFLIGVKESKRSNR